MGLVEISWGFCVAVFCPALEKFELHGLIEKFSLFTILSMDIAKMVDFLGVFEGFYGFFVKFCCSNTEGGRGAITGLDVTPRKSFPSVSVLSEGPTYVIRYRLTSSLADSLA